MERKVTSFNRKTSIELTNGSFIQTPAYRDTIPALMALILGPLLLVLLLACCNVTMVFRSRAVVRRGEIAVRLVLGVGRARLLRMLLLEAFLTALSSKMIPGVNLLILFLRSASSVRNAASGWLV
jgi:hypothetical protein